MPNIDSLRTKYDSERIFLIGNGPSLSQTPLESLTSEVTLAMNKINKIYSKSEWGPSIYYNITSVQDIKKHNGLKLEDIIMYIEENIDIESDCIIHRSFKKFFQKKENIYYVDRFQLNNREVPFHNLSIENIESMDYAHLMEYWSENVSYLVYVYHTMYAAIQTAVSLGFKKIYLVGCDLGMDYINPHMIFESAMDPFLFEGSPTEYVRSAAKRGCLFRSVLNAVALKSIWKIMDFDLGKYLSVKSEGYFSRDYADFNVKSGKKVDREIRKSHVAARRICEKKDVKIYNATLGGELEVHERVKLNTVI